MANLEISGFDELNAAIRRIGTLPPSVKTEALDKMAAVALNKIRSTGETMGVRDPESGVHILDKLTTTKAKTTETGGYEDVTFSGSRKRGKTTTRNAEIAFVNEYGKTGQPARPFVGQAMTRNENAIADPGIDVIGDWIEKEFNK